MQRGGFVSTTLECILFEICCDYCVVLQVAGVLPFITKFFETQFGVTSSSASLLAGACNVVGVMGGILFSSWLMKRRDVHGARLAKYTTWIAFIALFFMPAFLVRCSQPPIVGVSQAYTGRLVRYHFTSLCLVQGMCPAFGAAISTNDSQLRLLLLPCCLSLLPY